MQDAVCGGEAFTLLVVRCSFLSVLCSTRLDTPNTSYAPPFCKRLRTKETNKETQKNLLLTGSTENYRKERGAHRANGW